MTLKTVKLCLTGMILLLQSMAFAVAIPSVTNSLVGIQGYDPVAYFTDNKPMKGNGNSFATFNGVTYLFTNNKNRNLFTQNPQKYIPAYGGFCAFAVAQGIKVAIDPNAWKIVDGKLYLNLNKTVQKTWEKDISGNIKKADQQWQRIKDIPAGRLH